MQMNSIETALDDRYGVWIVCVIVCLSGRIDVELLIEFIVSVVCTIDMCLLVYYIVKWILFAFINIEKLNANRKRKVIYDVNTLYPCVTSLFNLNICNGVQIRSEGKRNSIVCNLTRSNYIFPNEKWEQD